MDGYSSFIQKVFRFKTGDGANKNGGSIIQSGDEFCWFYDVYDSSRDYCFASLFPVNQWYWFELHYSMPSGGKPTIVIYLDGSLAPALNLQSPTNSGSDAIAEYQLYGTINGGITKTFTYKWDAVRISTARLPLPVGAKVGVP